MQHVSFPGLALAGTNRFLSWILSLGTGVALAAGFIEDFSTDPAPRGWEVLGHPTPFAWNPDRQSLEVTWDSAQPNGFFARPLGLTLTEQDDFALAFDLCLTSAVAGSNPEKPGPFEIAVGFIRRADAAQPGFVRGNLQCANLVEFDYFPEGEIPGWGPTEPTISTAAVSGQRQPAAAFAFPLELTTGAVFHIELRYASANRCLSTTVTTGGQPAGTVEDLILPPTFSGFRLDAVAVASYTDTGDDFGSVFATGEIDSLRVSLPDPPPTPLIGGITNGLWQVVFPTRSPWQYRLESAPDTAIPSLWKPVSDWQDGNGQATVIQDPTPPTAPAAYYRVQVRHP